MEAAVLIAAHNEAERIAETVHAALAIPGVRRVVVADDGSGDSTAERAREAGAEVVRLGRNRGKGAALEAGAARVADADVVVLLDGDLGSTAEQGALLVAPIASGSADMSVAAFPPASAKAGFGLVMGLARWGIHTLGSPGFTPRAPLSGQRAMTRECFAIVRPFSVGYGTEVRTTVRALRAGLRIVEVDTAMSHAATGRDLKGFVHRGRQFAHVAIALAGLTAERAPSPHPGDPT